MQGQVWMMLIFIVMIFLVAILFMASTVPLGFVYKVSQDLTPEINDTDIENSVTTAQDKIWNLWWTVPTAMIVILILWTYAHSQRRESGSTWVSG